MDALTTFDFNSAPIRAVELNGEPWFVAKDVAEVLGYKNPHNAIQRHCKDVIKVTLPTNGGRQALSLIPEFDLHRLIMRSKLPTACKFEAWLVNILLPAIRLSGGAVLEKLNWSHTELLTCSLADALEHIELLEREWDALSALFQKSQTQSIKELS